MGNTHVGAMPSFAASIRLDVGHDTMTASNMCSATTSASPTSANLYAAPHPHTMTTE